MTGDRQKLLAYKLVTDNCNDWNLSSGCVRVVIADAEPSEVVSGAAFRTKHLAAWPVSFLVSGHVHSWAYLNSMCNILADRSGRIYLSAADVAQEPSEPLAAGSYYFKADDGSVASFSDGPEGKRRFEPPQPATALDRSSSSSGSDAASPRTQFHDDVVVREKGGCIVTRRPYRACGAVHLVPEHREDIYRHILRLDPEEPINTFSPACGILLSHELHAPIDSFAISFYVQDDESIVLYAFALALVEQYYASQGQVLPMHSKVIPRSFFIVEPELRSHFPPPNLAFFRWHYGQAVKMHVRGLAWGVRRDAISAHIAQAALP